MRTLGTGPITLTDPQEAPRYDGWLSRLLAPRLLEARDEVLLRQTLSMWVVMPLAMAALWVVQHRFAATAWVPWAASAAYLALWAQLVPPVILMLHCTMHRPFLRSASFNRWHPYTMSLLFGIPSGYREHHMGVHHMEDNMQEDLSSTMGYRRDSFLHFLMYFGRFFFLVPVELPLYLRRKGRKAMFRRTVIFEIAHEALVVGSLFVDWRFALPVFVLPFFLCRFAMMAGNWGQHAFINIDLPNNGIANSITCINSAYNRRCYNDGYHIGHHLKANRHWTELPGDFLANREEYARRGTVVFAGVDFFVVSLLLWTQQWRTLARCYVILDDAPHTEDEIVAMLKSRVHPVTVWPLEHIGVPATA